MTSPYTIVIPAKNEAASLHEVLSKIEARHPDTRVIVVNDGSFDETGSIAKQHNAEVISHLYSMGNGAAIKSGARATGSEFLIFMDADGQHQVEDIERLQFEIEKGYDMVVGARTSQANTHRALANKFYNWFSSWMVGQKVEDLTSGFRIVRTKKFKQFMYLLPNGFSYPTTITMCFFRAGFSVGYIPIDSPQRIGKSHMKIIRDGIRFLLIIFKVGTLYSPLKLFFPISLFFFLTGVAHYINTYISYNRFTNMSALLLVTSVVIFLVGLVSEQIASLNYKDSELHR